jgi:hemolysin III
LRKLDHSAIYLLIAGTYTPLTLVAMERPWGLVLFGVIWTLAVFGVVAKTTLGFRYPKLSVALYVIMGWVAVVALKPIIAALSTSEFAWLVAGGVVYTAGVPFYVWKSRRYTHALWHLFVLGGVACHFAAVLSIVTPRAA